MNIKTLVPDIYKTVMQDGWCTAEISDAFAAEIARRFQREERRPTLRLSKMGPWCPKALWHSVHTPELAVPPQPWTRIKWDYGHIVEAYALAAARAAGHRVEGEQDEVVVDGIKGHRDCVIDGCIVDVKSTTQFTLARLKNGTIQTNDLFGYLDQLDGYLCGSMDDPLVTNKTHAYLLAIDKTLGHTYLYEHRIRSERIKERIRVYKDVVALDQPPRCECATVPEGASGNIRLGVQASYSDFKYCCFPHLRTFIYANGPVFLSRVVKRPPGVKEVDKYGNLVYN